MKLAEALLERKSAKPKIDNLQERLEENALVQEGDTPAESPETLLAELRDALRRDMLKLQRQSLERAAAAMSLRRHRYGRNEVKFVATISQSKLRQEIDRLSKEWRELDAQIQAANWLTDVRESA